MLQQDCAFLDDSLLCIKKNGYIYLLLIFTLTVILSNPLIKNDISSIIYTIQEQYYKNNPITVTYQTSPENYQTYLPFINKEIPINTYFVSPDGDDSNPGTIQKPWRTIGKAARVAFPGMTIYLRNGIYNEVVEIRASGTEGEPIRFMAYPGETPIIDGSNQLPKWWVGLFSMYGDWIQVSGVETRNSLYDGFGLYGNHNTADNVNAHHNQYRGILIKGDHGIVINSRVWRNSLINEYGVLTSKWSSGISTANKEGIASNNVIRNNEVWENWGEGISAYMSDHCVVEYNTSHDNFSANFYISDATNILVQGNFAYMSPESYIYGYGSNVGFMMGDEQYTPPSANITIINNIAFGNRRNFYWWRGVQGGGMVNVLIANNTFVNSSETSNVSIMSGTHESVRFINNLSQQDGDLPIIILGEPVRGIYFHNNLWSKIPQNGYPNPIPQGDVVGDPFLEKNGDPFSTEWFLLTNESPAIERAQYLPEVNLDYQEYIRKPPPDIGAIEYINNP